MNTHTMNQIPDKYGMLLRKKPGSQKALINHTAKQGSAKSIQKYRSVEDRTASCGFYKEASGKYTHKQEDRNDPQKGIR
jgi:hypothetical protein